MGKKQPSEQTPVYAVVHASLRTQIFTGQYRPGDLLPSESHLCQEFGASRETVRRGLQQLENEGREYRVFFTENRSTIMRSAPCIFTRSRSRRKNCIYRSRK